MRHFVLQTVWSERLGRAVLPGEIEDFSELGDVRVAKLVEGNVLMAHADDAARKPNGPAQAPTPGPKARPHEKG